MKDELRIRELAYQIWESEGRPDGQAARHWEMACVLAETDGDVPPKPAPRVRRVSKPKVVPLEQQPTNTTPRASRAAKPPKT